MKALIEQLLGKNDAVAVYSDRANPSRFAVGLVVHADEHDMVMRHIGTTGAYDGYSVRRIEDVFRIDVMTPYEKTLLAMYEAREQQRVGCALEGLLAEGADLVNQAIHIACDRNLVVEVTMESSRDQESVVGFVLGSEGNVVEIGRLSNRGERTGTTHILGDDIIELFVDSEDDRVLALIANRATL